MAATTLLTYCIRSCHRHGTPLAVAQPTDGRLRDPRSNGWGSALVEGPLRRVVDCFAAASILAVSVMAAAPSAHATLFTFHDNLNGANEVTPTGSPFFGT